MGNRQNKLLQKVRGFIERQAMLANASGLILGVSGGPDSVVLLDVFARLRQATAAQGGAAELPLHVAHLNHRLRGRQSDEDAEFVRQLCERLAIDLTLEAVDVKAAAKASGSGIEETARHLRYQFFSEVASRQGCNRMATGHTMSDQAETLLMRLARGAGLRGLAAMRPVSKPPILPKRQAELDAGQPAELDSPATADPCLLIRPLLCVSREEIEAYCIEGSLPFRTDASNESLGYTRNRIRHKTLKALRELNPHIVERLARTAELIAGDQEALEYLACGFLDKAELTAEGREIRQREADRRQAYAIDLLLGQPVGLRRRMIIEALRRARQSARRKSGQSAELTSVHIKAVDQLLTEGRSGQHLSLPDGLRVWREFKALVFFHEQGPTRTEGYVEWLDPQHPRAEVAGLRIALLRRQPATLLAEVLEEAREEKARSGLDWKMAALDDALLPERLCLRPRRKGETAHVCGRQKNNKLKKLMIDHRIAGSRRETWPLLVTPDGEYVWSPGLPPALKFAASDGTQSLAIVRASDV
jgi:tRNA(Ile)-lysidine synthase